MKKYIFLASNQHINNYYINIRILDKLKDHKNKVKIK